MTLDEKLKTAVGLLGEIMREVHRHAPADVQGKAEEIQAAGGLPAAHVQWKPQTIAVAFTWAIDDEEPVILGAREIPNPRAGMSGSIN